MLKKIGFTLKVLGVFVLVLGLAGWAFYQSLDLDAEPVANTRARVADLGFVGERATNPHGRVLAVVTSTERFPDGGKRAGYELTELARAYWVFVANGYDVDIASPQGGEPPMKLDDELVDADHAFLNDEQARAKLVNSMRLADVDSSRYSAVYFVGGKGAMFDFPGNPDIARIIADIAPRGVVGAVCHGPAALLGVMDDEGVELLHSRRVTGFSNAEELFLIKDAYARFPFLLQDELLRRGAEFVEGPMYLDNTIVDERLVTGQNPWSTWSVAESMLRILGHEPVARERTTEEVSVHLLATLHRKGYDAAIAEKLVSQRASKQLLLMHSLVAAMQWRISESWAVLRLAQR